MNSKHANVEQIDENQNPPLNELLNSPKIQKDEKPSKPKQAMFQIGSGTGKIFAHSLAFPPSFGSCARDFLVETIVTYWNENTVDHVKYKTYGQVVAESIIDTTKPIPFSEVQVLSDLKRLVPQDRMVYSYKFCGAEVDWTKLVFSLRGLSIILDSKFDKVPLHKYSQVVDVVSQHYGQDRVMLISLLENLIGGPIINLAAMSDVRNVGWMMSKMKLANAVPLIHQIFCSPSIKGKITAIVRLLELYDVLWKDIAWSTIDKLAEYIFLAISWLMEKCKQMKDMASDSIEWISVKAEDMKARFTNSENVGIDIVRESVPVEGILCACGAPPKVGCSICRTHMCENCRKGAKHICRCENALAYIHFMDDCDCMNDLDCLYRAIAKKLNQDVHQVKQWVWQKLNRDHLRQDYENWRHEHPQVEHVWLDYDTWKLNCMNQMNINVMCETETIVLISLVYKRSTIVLNQIDSDNILTLIFPVNNDKQPFMLELAFAHYRYSAILPHSTRPTILIPGSALENYKMPNWKKEEHFSKPLVNLITPPLEPPKGSPPPEEIKPEMDTESIISHSSSSSSTDLSDIEASFIKYLSASDSASHRPSSSTDVEEKKVEEPKVEVSMEEKESFWELLKRFEWNEIGRRVAAWFRNSSTVLLSWFENNPFFAGCISIFIGISSYLGLNIVSFSGDPEAIGAVKKFTEASRAMYFGERGLSAIIGSVGKTIEAAKDVLGISVNEEIDTFKEQVSKMYTTANRLLSEASTMPGKFINDGQNFLDFKTHMEAIEKTYTNLAKMKDARSLSIIQPIWIGLNKTYEKLALTYNKLVTSAQTRQEPVVVYLYGNTNIGKSQLTTFLINKLTEALNEPDLRTFTISKGPQYWNGYAQQAVIRIDDMNAVVGQEGDTDSVIMFNLASSAAYNPNMASLEDKNIMFNGRYLFVCSNHKTLPSDSCVTQIDAWERRRDFFVHVTWPEHEGECGPQVKNCEHWKGKTVANFDHLTLRICNPVVTDVSNAAKTVSKIMKRPRYTNNNPNVKSDLEMDEEGFLTNLDDLVKAIIGKERENAQKFELAMQRVVRTETEIRKQVGSWVQKPHVMILGPPGTGKSYISERFAERNTNAKIHYIKTRAHFDEWAERNFTSTEPCTVIVDDLSLHVANPKFNNLLNRIHERNEMQHVPPDVWFLNGNEEVLDQALWACNPTAEFGELIYRRAEIIKTRFKSKRAFLPNVKIFKKCQTYYKREDITDPTQMDTYVEYLMDGKLVTQETVAYRLLSYKPIMRMISNKNALSLRESVPASTTLKIPRTHEAFIHMINNINIFTIMKFMAEGGCTCHSTTGKGIKDLCNIIYPIVTSAKKDMAGTHFENLDEILLQAWNKGMLDSLKGECFVLHLEDKLYYIDYVGDKVDCGTLYGRIDDLKDAIYTLDMTVKTIELSDLFENRNAILPHWMILGGEVVSKVFSVALTTASAMMAVSDQKQMFDALAFQLRVEKMLNHGFDNMKEALAENLNKKLSLNKQHPKYPGIQYPKSAQYSDVDDLAREQKADPKTFLEDYDPVFHENGDDSIQKKSDRRFKAQRENGDTSHEKKNQKPFRVKKEYCFSDFKKDQHKTQPVKETIRFQLNRNALTESNIRVRIEKEISTDPSLYPIIERVLKNCVEIVSLGGVRLCSGLIIRSKLVRTVAHILDTLPIAAIRARTFDGKIYKLKLVERCDVYDRLDMRIDDKTFQPRADLSCHLPNMATTIPDGTQVVMVTPDLSILHDQIVIYIRNYILNNICWKNFNGMAQKMHVIEYRGIRMGYTSTGVQTKGGDCGSVLIVADPNIDKKLIGMHFAASDTAGFASPLRSDHYLDTIKFQTASYTPDKKYFKSISDEVQPTLKAIAHDKPHIPAKSKLYANWIPIGPKKYEPCILSSYDTRYNGESLLRKESMRWCSPREELPAHMKNNLHIAMSEFVENYKAIFIREGVKLRKLTSMEALNKMSGTSASEPINIHTSAGFPWSTLSKKSGKTGYINVGANGERKFTNLPEDQPNRSLLQTEMAKLRNVDTAAKSDVVFQVFLKDELVKLKKVYETPRTRTIAVIPLHALIVFREYFHSAHVAMMEHWDKIGPKVGINPMSLDWHTFATNLFKVSTMGIDLDFSGWDFSHPPFFFELLCLFYNELYSALDPDCTEKDNLIRKTLYSKIKNFHLLIGQELHQSTGGLPSGYPGTTPDNSIINEFMMYYSYKEIMKRVNPVCANITSFYEDVALGTYGDDVILAISEWASSHYHGVSIAQELSPLGFTVQSSEKSQDVATIKPLFDCTFLSRRFVLRGAVIVGPLKEDNLFKPTHYSSDRRSHYFWESPLEKIAARDIVQNVYESILYNAALDARHVFDRCYKAAMEISRMTNGPLPPTFNDCIARMYGYIAPVNRITGLEFFNMPELLAMNLGHPRPKHYEVFKNRVCYQYGVSYRFGGKLVECNPIPANLQRALDFVNNKLEKKYNSFLINLYPAGGEIPWHKDSEQQLDRSQGVFGITIVGDGRIHFKNVNFLESFYMEPGLGYLMDETNLSSFQHMRDSHTVDSMSITFRRLVPPV